VQKLLYYKDITDDTTEMKSYLNTNFKVADIRIIAKSIVRVYKYLVDHGLMSKVHYIKFVILMS